MNMTHSSATQRSLARAPVLIGGRERLSDFAPVVNPAHTDEVVGEFALGTKEHVDAAVDAATSAMAHWSTLSAVERAGYLLRAADLLEAGSAERAALLTREVGKVLWESRVDVGGAPLMLRYYASLADEVERLREAPINSTRGHAVLRRVPAGPVGIITPWNTPVHLGFMALAPALIAGNTAVVKVPEEAPLALSDGLQILAAVLPQGVLSIVPGVGEVAGAALAAHPGVRHLSFTGSIETGKSVVRAGSGNLKTLSLELGGNDPAIVLDDVEINERLLSEFLAGIFSLSGQICYNIKRIYVDQSRYEEFSDALTAAASTIVVGDGLEPKSTMGPVTTKAGYDRLRSLADEVVARGAKVRTVGQKLAPENWDKGYFILPSVVTNVDSRDELVTGEQFGPVIPVLPFANIDDAVRMANDTEYGLAASVWSSDVERARAVARGLEAGSAFVNVHRVGASPMDVQFGGMKQSGLGRNHGMRAVLAGMEEQVLIHFDDTADFPGATEWAGQLAGVRKALSTH